MSASIRAMLTYAHCCSRFVSTAISRFDVRPLTSNTSPTRERSTSEAGTLKLPSYTRVPEAVIAKKAKTPAQTAAPSPNIPQIAGISPAHGFAWARGTPTHPRGVGRELSYYHGVDDGEAWSEGRRYGTLYVPSVPAGRYYLRVEPETDSPQLNFRVAVKRDVPLKRVPLIALGLLLLPALWAGMRHSAFENTRWMESDHPRSSSDDEEDE